MQVNTMGIWPRKTGPAYTRAVVPVDALAASSPTPHPATTASKKAVNGITVNEFYLQRLIERKITRLYSLLLFIGILLGAILLLTVMLLYSNSNSQHRGQNRDAGAENDKRITTLSNSARSRAAWHTPGGSCQQQICQSSRESAM